jgi:hypothetical protein
MMTPVGTAMLFRAFPPSERARASAVITMPTAIAPALGPVLGGWLVDNASWRWIFYVNLPVGFVTLIFVLYFIREHREHEAGRFDVLFLLPLFLQELRGISALKSGLTTFPRALGMLLMVPLSSRLYPRVGPRRMLTGAGGHHSHLGAVSPGRPRDEPLVDSRDHVPAGRLDESRHRRLPGGRVCINPIGGNRPRVSALQYQPTGRRVHRGCGPGDCPWPAQLRNCLPSCVCCLNRVRPFGDCLRLADSRRGRRGLNAAAPQT